VRTTGDGEGKSLDMQQAELLDFSTHKRIRVHACHFFMAAAFVVTRGFLAILVILLEKKHLFFSDVLGCISRDLHITAPLI
jgi:hypothetical protein